MKIERVERGPAGFHVRVEIPNAYTDGKSRFEDVTISAQEARGKTREQLRELVRQHIEDDFSTMSSVVGTDFSAPISATKTALELNMRVQYEEWQRWKNTHAEAVARSAGTAALRARLLARVDKEWGEYTRSIQAWDAAP